MAHVSIHYWQNTTACYDILFKSLLPVNEPITQCQLTEQRMHMMLVVSLSHLSPFYCMNQHDVLCCISHYIFYYMACYALCLQYVIMNIYSNGLHSTIHVLVLKLYSLTCQCTLALCPSLDPLFFISASETCLFVRRYESQSTAAVLQSSPSTLPPAPTADKLHSKYSIPIFWW